MLGAQCPFGELAHVRFLLSAKSLAEGFRGKGSGNAVGRMMLRCEECHAVCEYAAGWIAYRIDDEEEPEIVVYCPQCAEREFEVRSPRTQGRSRLEGRVRKA